MRRELTHELEVAAPADAIWEVYSALDLHTILIKLFPGTFESIKIIEGDGGVGSVLHLVFPPGSISPNLKEKFVKIDHEERLKEVLLTEGGYLELGCTFYTDTFHILEKDCDSCIIKSVTTFEVGDDKSNIIGLISIDSVASMAKAISEYVLENL